MSQSPPPQIDINIENKRHYGEVITPHHLVDMMLDMLPKKVFEAKNMRWLDPGSGTGHFIHGVMKRVRKPTCRHRMFGIELNEDRLAMCEKWMSRRKYAKDVTLYAKDFMDVYEQEIGGPVDLIVGNPPYNAGGLKKVPTNTNTEISKRDDGNTPWCSFVRHGMSLLKPGGMLLFIIPTLWMKEDKAGMHDFIIRQHNLLALRCFDNTETNHLFSGQAQTPTSIILVQKNPAHVSDLRNIGDTVSVRTWDRGEFIDYKHVIGKPLPVCFGNILMKVSSHMREGISHIQVEKTMMPSKKNTIRRVPSDDVPHKNIRSCVLSTESGGLEPELVFEYSQVPCAFYGVCKVVLAHKMYGFPFIDAKGVYGVSNRDNYVVRESVYGRKWMHEIAAFLSTRLSMCLFESTRYRMKYLEKYIFELLPDISKLPGFPQLFDSRCVAQCGFEDYEKAVMTYFGLTDGEQDRITRHHSKRYRGVVELALV